MSSNATLTRSAGMHPRAPRAPLPQVVSRIRSEYEEMPGLCLTRPQAERLWGLDPDICEAVLAALVDAGFLKSTTRGYLRA